VVAMRERLRILLVEDNAGDVVLVREALSRLPMAVDLDWACDGAEAMDYLHARQREDRLGSLDLVVLDLNLPGKNGKEVLAEIEADPILRGVRVAILTSSRYDSDICERHPGVACRFFAKTPDLHELYETVATIVQFAGGR
jgi:two-component system, chemotaxis family, response regulator Rcp1